VAETFNFTFVSKIKFPFQKVISQEILPRLIEKKNQQYVLPTLANYFSAIVSFDL
jgi:hypothetical protein